MIKKFVARFDSNRDKLLEHFRSTPHPEHYGEIVKAVVEVISGDEPDGPDPNRIHYIDDGEYQGTLLFVIAEKGYQPDKYWAVPVSYGSCSGCDTLEDIRDYEDGIPSPTQAQDYLTLALHIVQGLRQITGNAEADSD